MPNPRYFTEVGVLQATKGVALLKPAELYSLERMPEEAVKRLDDSHVYMVCQRPRVRFGAVGKVEPTGASLDLTIGTESGEKTRTLQLPGFFVEGVAEFRIEENGAYISAEYPDGSKGRKYPPEVLLHSRIGIPELSELEVVYVGQACGEGESRSSVKRLLSHSTLQKVLAEQAHQAWWMEPVLLLFVFDGPRLLMKMDGIGTPDVIGKDDYEHFMTIADTPLSAEQLVTIAEASLIRYFRPKYNVHFKDCYPTNEMRHLREAYRLDLGGIVTEIDTEDIFVNTFSDQAPASDHHIAQFDLHDTDERLSFFEVSARPAGSP